MIGIVARELRADFAGTLARLRDLGF